MWNELNDSSDLATVENDAMEVAAAPVTSVARVSDDASPLALMVNAARGIVRSPKVLIEQAKQIGGLLGKDGFYRFPAGGAAVTGVSIDLAEALAQQWGGIAYQVRILNVEQLHTGGRKVHLRATVTDLKTLVAAEVDQVVSTSAPPGKFSKNNDQSERWHAMQTQSAASKIVRNAILRVLPAWYVNAAFEAAVSTDAQSATNGKSLPEARKGAVEHLTKAHGLTVAELEAVTGQPLDMWAAPQLGQLRDLAGDLKSSRISVEQVRASLREEPAAAKPSGKSALGLAAKTAAPVATTRDPDDEPPPFGPTGTDGGRGSSDDARGDGAEASTGAGAQARATVHELRVERDEPASSPRDNFAASPEAWEAHLEDAEDEWAAAGSYHKRSGAFNRANVADERKRATVTAIARRMGGDMERAQRFLDAFPTTRRPARKAANG